MEQKGFTLIELILYVAILAIVVIAILTFAWTFINDQQKQQRLTEVDDSGAMILDQIIYQVKNANSVDGETVFDSNPGKLVINFPSQPQITFDTYEKNVTLGDVVTTIKILRMTEDASPAVHLTSEAVTVTNFVINDLSNSIATTLQIQLSLEAVNPAGAQAYEAQNSWTTSVTLWQK